VWKHAALTADGGIHTLKLTSVVSYPKRGEGGNNKYRGNCSPKLIEDLIGHFKPAIIHDFMCGSGTTKDAAAKMGIESKVFDLHSGFDLTSHDIADRPEFTFWHPPYHDIVVYSDKQYKAADVIRDYGYDPRETDLSRIPTWEGFVKVMNYCMMKQYAALEKGGRMAVLVGDIKKKGKLYSMIFELTKPGTLENVVIKTQHNCDSDGRQYSGNFIPIVHEYVLIVRKDNGLAVPIMLTRTVQSDIRDMQNATWKDVVAGILADYGQDVELSRVYEKVDGHKKTETNQYWKEKIRQTLHGHPDIFAQNNDKWRLAKAA
jgi:hypothetical protein